MGTPVIAVIGNSDAGKTTLACHLVRTFTAQGHRVAAVKHCPHGHEASRAGSDTERLYEAGASVVVASSPDRVTQTERVGEDSPLATITDGLDDVDLVIVEGYKSSAVPKVLVTNGRSSSPMVDNVVAVVGEGDVADVPTYRPDDLEGLVKQIREQLPARRSDEVTVSLEIDGEPVPLGAYPTSALGATVLGFVSSLKGVPDHPREVTIRVTVGAFAGRPTRPGPGPG